MLIGISSINGGESLGRLRLAASLDLNIGSLVDGR